MARIYVDKGAFFLESGERQALNYLTRDVAPPFPSDLTALLREAGLFDSEKQVAIATGP